MQNKIKLFNIIEDTFNHLPIVMEHHNRDFINEAVQTVSKKSIMRFKQGQPGTSIVIPVSLNDDSAKKIMDMKMSEYGRDMLLKYHALSKMVARTFEIADPIAVPGEFDEVLKKDAQTYQNIISKGDEKLTRSDFDKMAEYYFHVDAFANYCERAFKQTRVHVLFTDIHKLSVELQMELNAYVQARLKNLKIGYAFGTGDLKTISISENHFLQETHDVHFHNIDRKYWQENIYDEAQYDDNIQAFRDSEKYIHRLNKNKNQHILPLEEFRDLI